MCNDTTTPDGLRVLTNLTQSGTTVTFVSVVGPSGTGPTTRVHDVTEQLRVQRRDAGIAKRFDVEVWRPTGWVTVLRALEVPSVEAAAVDAFRVLHTAPE
jgi:hypothetical protein